VGPLGSVLGDNLSSTEIKGICFHVSAEMGSLIHAVEDEMLCSSLLADKVAYFNAPIDLQNKSVIGKVDDILGPINQVLFSVKMGEGMVASSFRNGDKVYIGADKLLPIERFFPKPKSAGGECSS
jgi:H/ACA ribonucleoprotein complex subunit 1